MNALAETISPEELRALQMQGHETAVFDVRTPAEYRAGHAPGATLLPLDEINADTVAAHDQFMGTASAERCYLLCRSGSRAEQAAQRLSHYGIKNLTLVAGGMEAWEKAGLPTQSCGKAISLERQVQIAIGSLLLAKVVFGFTVHELFFAATALIGAGLIVAGTTRWCGMARLIARLPWNRARGCPEGALR